MTTTLDPPVAEAVRPPPYLRRLAARTAEWTVTVITVTAAMQAATFLTGSSAVGALAGLGAAVMAWLATQRQPWAQRVLAVVWLTWLIRWAVFVHDLPALVVGIEAVAIAAGSVAAVLALGDVARQARGGLR